MQTTTTREDTDKKIDQAMGLLLRTGVVLAAAIVLAGGGLYLHRHAVPAVNYSVFQGEPQIYRTIPGILGQAKALSGRGLIQLGLLILIATPVARVIFSVFAFTYERDWKYVGFTLVVLALLLYSLFGHGLTPR
jgi:uncharacterized membrane protein